MNIPAIKIVQNNQELFLFSLNAKFIYSHFDVSRRLDDKLKGYQRSFTKSRISQIQRYIGKENGIIPNAVLINIDSGKAEYAPQNRELIIKDQLIEKNDPLGFIIDGQHRIWGANEVDQDFTLPVIATIGLTVKEQAKLFIKINQEQKGVPVSLYLDLLDLTDGIIEDFDSEEVNGQRRGIEIAKRLNDDEESPLYGLIRTTGESGRGVALNEFVNQIKVYVDPKKGKLLNYGFEDQYKLFKIYFRAIKAVFLGEWDDNSSLILKTVGFGGLMKAFYEIFQLTIQGGRTYSTDNLIELLQKISDFKFSNENLPGGGIKAQEEAGKTLVNRIKKELKEDSDYSIEISD